MKARILFYVTGHGFGHATRTVAVIDALRCLGPKELGAHVRTSAPHWLFTDDDPATVCSSADLDVGMIQKNGIDTDLPASLAAHRRLGERWDLLLEEESAFIKSVAPSVVVADVPALPCAAARRCGVPAIAMSNMSWDWILEPYAEADPAWRPVVERYAGAYAEATALLRMPLHGDLPAFRTVIDVGLVVREARSPRREVRRRLGLRPEDPRRMVLVSFGGFGSGIRETTAGEDLSGFFFVGFAPKPSGLKAEWRALPTRTPMRHIDLVAASDVMIGKPGFGTVAEALAHRVRMLYLDRPGYREIPALTEGLELHGCARPIPREDFFAGRWRAHLEALLEMKDFGSPLAADGAEAIARHLLAA
ncbi:MAG: hypothetical protein ABII00_17580 [Elusimicrobiota bacterium]